jgi:tetratricopeptide (TPR) repeat protein
VGATKVTISQFSYLVKWQQSDGVKIPPAALEQLFDDALQNPRWVPTGRAGIEAAYREYHEFVSGDLERALVHADRAIAAWPDQWSYHMQKVRVLRKLARLEAALRVLDDAERLAGNNEQLSRVQKIRQQITEAQAR